MHAAAEAEVPAWGTLEVHDVTVPEVLLVVAGRSEDHQRHASCGSARSPHLTDQLLCGLALAIGPANPKLDRRRYGAARRPAVDAQPRGERPFILAPLPALQRDAHLDHRYLPERQRASS